MDIQEIIVFGIVGLAAVYAIRVFIRQFTHGEGSCSECSKCGGVKSTETIFHPPKTEK